MWGSGLDDQFWADYALNHQAIMSQTLDLTGTELAKNVSTKVVYLIHGVEDEKVNVIEASSLGEAFREKNRVTIRLLEKRDHCLNYTGEGAAASAADIIAGIFEELRRRI